MTPGDLEVLRGARWGRQLATLLEGVPGDVSHWMEQHTRLLKSDSHSHVGLLQLDGRPCYLKFYLASSTLQNLAFRLGYGRGIRSFDMAGELIRAGLDVPEPLTCLRISEGMLLLTEGIESGRDLRAVWRGQAAEDPAGLLRRAGESLAALHLAGFAHGDCKWSNLLCCGKRIYLVDLEAVRRIRVGGARRVDTHPRQSRDLARFTVDAEELGVGGNLYECFLQGYCARAGRGRDSIVASMQPGLNKIRRRHRARYGSDCETLA